MEGRFVERLDRLIDSLTRSSVHVDLLGLDIDERKTRTGITIAVAAQCYHCIEAGIHRGSSCKRALVSAPAPFDSIPRLQNTVPVLVFS